MHDDEDLQVVGTTSEYLIQQLTDKEEGKDFAVDYFKSGFMSSRVALFFLLIAALQVYPKVAIRSLLLPQYFIINTSNHI